MNFEKHKQCVPKCLDISLHLLLHIHHLLLFILDPRADHVVTAVASFTAVTVPLAHLPIQATLLLLVLLLVLLMVLLLVLLMVRILLLLLVLHLVLILVLLLILHLVLILVLLLVL